eukprot:COSAG06_NODE_9279_length_1943_cov_1.140141_2_plen_145_part_00
MSVCLPACLPASIRSVFYVHVVATRVHVSALVLQSCLSFMCTCICFPQVPHPPGCISEWRRSCRSLLDQARRGQLRTIHRKMLVERTVLAEERCTAGRLGRSKQAQCCCSLSHYYLLFYWRSSASCSTGAPPLCLLFGAAAECA